MEEPKSRIYIGIRWGMNNPTVMLAGEYTPAPRDHLHIFRELYEENFYFDDLLPIAQAWAQELTVRKFYCDPKEPEFIKRMRKYRLWAVPVTEELGLAHNLLGKRIAKMIPFEQQFRIEADPKKRKALMQSVPGGISFSREMRNTRTLAEFFRYRMPERDPRKPYRDKPLDMDNYGIGALHFLLLGLANETTPRIRWI